MPSILSCVTNLFRPRSKTPRQVQETGRTKSSTSPAATQSAQSESVQQILPPVDEIIESENEHTVRTSTSLPTFARHISEEPIQDSRESSEVTSEYVAIEEDTAREPEIEAIEQYPHPSLANEAVEPPIPSKAHLPKLSVTRATLTEPLELNFAENRVPNESPALETSRLTRESSNASSRSRSDSKASSTTGHWLKEQLEDARIEYPEKSHSFYIPKCKQEELITPDIVTQDILARNPDIGRECAAEYAKKACEHARQLYATLAYIKNGAEICKLLDECITDDDLPLIRMPNKKSRFALYRLKDKKDEKSTVAIQTMENWKDKYLENFDKVQRWMMAPTFEEGEHHEFDGNTILPYVPFEKSDWTQEHMHGAYSKVYPVQIHYAHQKFFPDIKPEEDQPLVAVKQLFSSEKTEFEKEATILQALGPKQHPHLIKLLATFEKAHEGQQTYYLLFPYANANLRKYWHDHPNPKFDKDTVMWTTEQMTGIASGLRLIHDFKVTHALYVPGSGKGNFRNPGNVELKVKEGEQWYGRHGDIKPENILWFKKGLHCRHLRGVLQIADFGLGRFHGRESRSGINPDSVMASPTYEPPECKLKQPVSRAYDLWSLGCLYLEFITWLLKGNDDIEGFSEARGRTPTGKDVNDDYFYTIITSRDGTTNAVVREGVDKWVAQLHAHEKCSQLIHDLLKIIMNDLLVVDTKKRAQSAWLYLQLKDCLGKAKDDAEYMLKAVPTPNEEPDAQASLEAAKSKVKQRISFSEQQKPARPGNNTHPKSQPILDRPMDLLGREKGTPGLAKKIGHPRTWPVRQQTMY